MEIKKLSEHLQKTCPDVKLEDAKKAIIAYRDYMFNLRRYKNYCDVCYNLISEDESAKTSMHDFNYCCDKHIEFKSAHNLDRVREEIGLTVEHLPHLDIYG